MFYTVCLIAERSWNLAMRKWLSYDTSKCFRNLTSHQLASPLFQFYYAWIYEDNTWTIHWVLHQLSSLQYELGGKFVDAPLKVYIRHCVARNADKTKECLEFYIKNQVQLFSLKFKDHWMILGQILSRVVNQNDIVQFHLIE